MICMKRQSLFSGKSVTNITKMLCAEIFTQYETNILERLFNRVRYSTISNSSEIKIRFPARNSISDRYWPDKNPTV